MSGPKIALLDTRVFCQADQTLFAALTGDHNPLHEDPIAARRTAAGAPVVHGIHLLLWLLESIAQHYPDASDIATLRVQFRKVVYLGERCEARLTDFSAQQIRGIITVSGVQVLDFTAARGLRSDASTVAGTAAPRLHSARDVGLANMAHSAGEVGFASMPAQYGAAFPGSALMMGARRVAALGGSTYLVGMVVPGLHSIYAGLELKLVNDGENDILHYAVTSVDERLRRVMIQISGGGVSGTLQTFARPPPMQQFSMKQAASLVNPNEFARSHALVVGGSRGLGEVTAKLLAAGGSEVMLSYAQGAADADQVASQIRAGGGRCSVAPYDVRAPAAAQLRALAQIPSHYFYFATPTIVRRKRGLCDQQRLQEFNQFYVHGFLALIDAALELRPDGICVFYPSTIYIVDRPADMTEYAMSKAAGEILCADLCRFKDGLRIVTQRLPRLATDQTASMVQQRAPDAADVILPILRSMYVEPTV